MNNGIDSKAEVGPSTPLTEIDRLQNDFDVQIDEFQEILAVIVDEAEDALLAVRALGRRIFVENPHGLDATDEPSQLPTEDD